MISSCCRYSLHRVNPEMKILTQLFLSLLTLELKSCSKDYVEKGEKLQSSTKDSKLKPEKMVLSPPVLSPEEEGSQFLPQAHRCDGCIAIAYQVSYFCFKLLFIKFNCFIQNII